MKIKTTVCGTGLTVIFSTEITVMIIKTSNSILHHHFDFCCHLFDRPGLPSPGRIMIGFHSSIS